MFSFPIDEINNNNDENIKPFRSSFQMRENTNKKNNLLPIKHNLRIHTFLITIIDDIKSTKTQLVKKTNQFQNDPDIFNPFLVVPNIDDETYLIKYWDSLNINQLPDIMLVTFDAFQYFLKDEQKPLIDALSQLRTTTSWIDEKKNKKYFHLINMRYIFSTLSDDLKYKILPYILIFEKVIPEMNYPKISTVNVPCSYADIFGPFSRQEKMISLLQLLITKFKFYKISDTSIDILHRYQVLFELLLNHSSSSLIPDPRMIMKYLMNINEYLRDLLFSDSTNMIKEDMNELQKDIKYLLSFFQESIDMLKIKDNNIHNKMSLQNFLLLSKSNQLIAKEDKNEDYIDVDYYIDDVLDQKNDIQIPCIQITADNIYYLFNNLFVRFEPTFQKIIQHMNILLSGDGFGDVRKILFIKKYFLHLYELDVDQFLNISAKSFFLFPDFRKLSMEIDNLNELKQISEFLENSYEVKYLESQPCILLQSKPYMIEKHFSQFREMLPYLNYITINSTTLFHQNQLQILNNLIDLILRYPDSGISNENELPLFYLLPDPKNIEQIFEFLLFSDSKFLETYSFMIDSLSSSSSSFTITRNSSGIEKRVQNIFPNIIISQSETNTSIIEILQSIRHNTGVFVSIPEQEQKISYIKEPQLINNVVIKKPLKKHDMNIHENFLLYKKINIIFSDNIFNENFKYIKNEKEKLISYPDFHCFPLRFLLEAFPLPNELKILNMEQCMTYYVNQQAGQIVSMFSNPTFYLSPQQIYRFTASRILEQTNDLQTTFLSTFFTYPLGLGHIRWHFINNYKFCLDVVGKNKYISYKHEEKWDPNLFFGPPNNKTAKTPLYFGFFDSNIIFRNGQNELKSNPQYLWSMLIPAVMNEKNILKNTIQIMFEIVSDTSIYYLSYLAGKSINMSDQTIYECLVETNCPNDIIQQIFQYDIPDIKIFQKLFQSLEIYFNPLAHIMINAGIMSGYYDSLLPFATWLQMSNTFGSQAVWHIENLLSKENPQALSVFQKKLEYYKSFNIDLSMALYKIISNNENDQVTLSIEMSNKDDYLF